MKRTSRVLSAALTAIFCIGLLTGLPPSAKAADDYPSEYKSAEHSTVVDRWRFFNRECTSFVAWCLESRNGVVGFNNRYGGVLWGNAKDWAGGARALGIVVDMNPAVGSVAWTDDGIYGHVAWVSAVSGDNITIEDYNSWGYSGAYNVRTVHKSTFRGFIHIKDMIAVP
ncbi:MAG: CHAP domain-containing protein, partial [Oscillospiraceae bacterium]|nr:CHAP domain-containing protein [Oscillospiraceae bacterium]